MTTSRLFRLSGIALMFGSMVCAGAMLMHPDSPRDPLDGPLHVAYLPCLLLILLGLPVVIARQTGRSGVLSLVGVLALWFGLALAEVPHSVIDATMLPALLADPSTNGLVDETSVLFTNLMQGPFGVMMMVAQVLLLIGALVLPFATLRAAMLPRWPSIVLFAAVPATVASMASPVVPGAIGPFLLFTGLAGFGVALAFNLGPERVRDNAHLAPAGTVIRQLLLVTGTLAAASMFAIGDIGEVSAAHVNTVDIIGTQDLGAPTGEVFNFKQGRIVIRRNETVTWRNLGPEPHSITIVDNADVAQTVSQVNNCPVCEQVIGLHAPTVGADGPQPPFVAALNGFRASAASRARLEERGDSLFLAEHQHTYPSTTGGTIGDSVSAVITAPEGTTLSYVCAIHPWMQGTIQVLRNGTNRRDV